jgi:predicted TPR repeat methyltransferase/Flp pilus assembly protein TadD
LQDRSVDAAIHCACLKLQWTRTGSVCVSRPRADASVARSSVPPSKKRADVALTLASSNSVVLPSLEALQAEISEWRALHPQFDSHLAIGVAPAKALRHLGLSAWGRGDVSLAASVLRAAVVLAPDDAPLWADLSGVYFACAQPAQARACLLASLERDDRDPSRWLSLAGLYRAANEDVEAERAFRRAIDLDPSLDDAWVGLGILKFQQRRLPSAVEALCRAIDLGSSNVAVHACLAEALYLQGDIAGASKSYARQVEITPNEAKIVAKFAFVRLLDGIINGGLDESLLAYRQTAGAEALDERTVISNAFHALSGYDHKDAAIRCGHALLLRTPDDPVPRYLIGALEGAATPRAPDDYLIRTFDQFADTFDHKLVDVLDYRVPEKMQREITAMGESFPHCLDAGCGTGLAAPLLRDAASTLTGIDLSGRMLEKAAQRGLYDRLVECEIHEFLAREETCFDMIFAADVLVYIGDLKALMDGAARRLRRGGIFAFSVETNETADYILLPSGRFAHQRRYIKDVSSGSFVIERSLPTQIRLDARGPAQGMIFLLRRL